MGNSPFLKEAENQQGLEQGCQTPGRLNVAPKEREASSQREKEWFDLSVYYFPFLFSPVLIYYLF